MYFDVFNGDADGLCALVQVRLANPQISKLVTGVKRDIQLLDNLTVTQQDVVTVLDISLKKNRDGLVAILQQGAQVLYVDHHETGDIPICANLTTIINTAPTTCTSLLVDEYLNGKYRAWALVAACGDNLLPQAEQLAKTLDITTTQFEHLKKLGICLNYNAYGHSGADLHFAPDELYKHLVQYASPLDFLIDKADIFEQLQAGYATDLELAQSTKPEYQDDKICVYILPDEAWARRINGVMGNDMANLNPQRAHAVLTYNAQGAYQVSVRAPIANKQGADELCGLFKTGGGRKSAAGINHLPLEALVDFIAAFKKQYQ